MRGWQSEKRTLSRRYLENYFSGVWKSIAGGDNDHREGGERANLSDRRCPHSHALSFSPSPLPSPAVFFFLFFSCLFIRPIPPIASNEKRKEGAAVRVINLIPQYLVSHQCQKIFMKSYWKN